MKPRILALLLSTAVLSGCHHMRVSTRSTPDPDLPPARIRVDTFMWGLVAPDQIDLARLPGDGCRGGLNQTVEEVRWWQLIATIVTAGLYGPHDLIVECAT